MPSQDAGSTSKFLCLVLVLKSMSLHLQKKKEDNLAKFEIEFPNLGFGWWY